MAESAPALDSMPPERARATLSTCCGSSRWVEEMLSRAPFGTRGALFQTADSVWSSLGREDILEAFAQHPEIGGDIARLRERFAVDSVKLSEREQVTVQAASEATLLALRDGNRAYKERFGYIFIVCATGKSADEMLVLLRERLNNDPRKELEVAAREQAKITRLRLEKLAA